MEAHTYGVPSGDSWESLKHRAKGLKSELDAKMQELGRLNKRLSNVGGSSASSKPGDRLDALEGQIEVVVGLRSEVEQGLAQLEDASEAMSRIASTSTQAAQAARFRETQQEMTRDFKRVAQSIEHQYQHARLLPKSRGGRGQDGGNDEEDGLMRERSGLSSSLSMADDIIQQASATRDMLVGQRGMLHGVKSKVGMLESLLPGVSGLIDSISDRKNKERVVLSFTVACCVTFTIWYKIF